MSSSSPPPSYIVLAHRTWKTVLWVVKSRATAAIVTIRRIWRTNLWGPDQEDRQLLGDGKVTDWRAEWETAEHLSGRLRPLAWLCRTYRHLLDRPTAPTLSMIAACGTIQDWAVSQQGALCDISPRLTDGNWWRLSNQVATNDARN